MSAYDAIVIGSGQAGNPLSQKLADQGWSVALIEQDQLGGTCINTGCTPTKTMMASAQVAHYVRNASRWGVNVGEVGVDLPGIVARKDRTVSQWRSGIEQKIEERKSLRLYRGHARFVGPHEVRVGDETLRPAIASSLMRVRGRMSRSSTGSNRSIFSTTPASCS